MPTRKILMEVLVAILNSNLQTITVPSQWCICIIHWNPIESQSTSFHFTITLWTTITYLETVENLPTQLQDRSADFVDLTLSLPLTLYRAERGFTWTLPTSRWLQHLLLFCCNKLYAKTLSHPVYKPLEKIGGALRPHSPIHNTHSSNFCPQRRWTLREK